VNRREELQRTLAENDEWMRQLRLERDAIDAKVISLSLWSDEIREELRQMAKPQLRAVS
jgi:hypothetical protein